MTAKLSTHVLDTYHGCPAGGIFWELSILASDGTWDSLKEGKTNEDGRTDEPLLLDDALLTGSYRLTFSVSDYFKSKQVNLPDPPFLGNVSLEVNLIAGQSYHVPLLVSPWSYSTYRGS